jgi:hypothetical protein
MTDEFGVSLFGNEGGAEIHVKDYALTDTLRVFGDFEGVPTDARPRLQKTHGHTEIIHSFVDAILTGAPMSPSGEEGLDRTRLIDAIYRSAALGREVELSAISFQPSAVSSQPSASVTAGELLADRPFASTELAAGRQLPARPKADS